MAIGERIRHIRGLRGLTLKFLGKAAGFHVIDAEESL